MSMDHNYTEPEDMGRDMGGVHFDRLTEQFLRPGENYSEMLMRNRLDQTDITLVTMALMECAEADALENGWVLLSLVTGAAGAAGKAFDAALASIARTQPFPPTRKRGWGFKRNPPAEPEPQDFEG